jgi:hypothetical protein
MGPPEQIHEHIDTRHLHVQVATAARNRSTELIVPTIILRDFRNATPCSLIARYQHIGHLFYSGSVFCWGAMQQGGRSPVRVPDEVDSFNLILPAAIWPWESTQPLTEMSIRKFLWGKGGWRIGLTNFPPSTSRMSENMGASTSYNPKGVHGLYRIKFIFIFKFYPEYGGRSFNSTSSVFWVAVYVYIYNVDQYDRLELKWIWKRKSRGMMVVVFLKLPGGTEENQLLMTHSRFVPSNFF